MNQSDIDSVLDDIADINQCHSRQMKFYGETHADVSWCPTPDCKYMFVYEDGDNDKLSCPLCSKLYCLKCRAPYHEEMTCDENRIENNYGEADKQFEQYVRGNQFK